MAVFRFRDGYHRHCKAGSTCAYKISQQDDRKRQRGIHGSSYDRSQHKGAGLHELVPAIGSDQLVRRYQLRHDGLDGRCMKYTSQGPNAQNRAGRPVGRMAHPQEDSKDHGYQADEHIRCNGHMFPFQAVNPHPGKGTQEDLGQKCHQAG